MSLFTAWGLPMLLALRNIDPSSSSMVTWQSVSSYSGEGCARIEVRQGVCSDVYTAFRSTRIEPEASRWPTGMLMRVGLASARFHYPPGSVITAPDVADYDDFTQIQTTLSGWPFRAFASEAWQPVDGARGAAPTGFRCAVQFGFVDDRALLVPLRPIIAPLIADVLVWTSVAWIVVAFPLALRRRKREKFGRCTVCGFALDPHAAHRAQHCPACSAALPRDVLSFARSPEMRFQNAYVWFIFFSSLDIMLTWKILEIDGVEVNPVAALVIDAWGMQGAVAFKFALVMWVIVMCELLARLRMSTGKAIAIAAICLSALPVVWSLVLLTLHTFFPRVFEA